MFVVLQFLRKKTDMKALYFDESVSSDFIMINQKILMKDYKFLSGIKFSSLKIIGISSET